MPHELYQKAIMRHAAKAVGAGRLDAPDASVVVDNPLCGDRVTLDIAVEDGRITALAHHLHACVLCQASASILAANAVGLSAAEIGAARAALEAMLKSGGPAPEGRFAALEVFEPVARERNRHTCVLLPFEAALKALGEASADV